MSRSWETERLFKEVSRVRRKKILSKLKLPLGRGRIPQLPAIEKIKKRFYYAAWEDLRPMARQQFRGLIVGPPRPFFFTKRKATVGGVRRIRKDLLPLRRLIYVYLGYKRGDLKKRVYLYVGRTRGRGGRIAGHARVLQSNRVTQINVFRVADERWLGAAECAAIHHYQPSENKMRAARSKGWKKCRICKLVKMGWKEFKPLVRSSV